MRRLLLLRCFASPIRSSPDSAAMQCLARPLPGAGPSPSLRSSGPAAASVRFGRRRFWAVAAAAAGGCGKEAAFPARESLELLGIPGVGPRNLRKLVDGGLRDLARLKQLYRDKV